MNPYRILFRGVCWMLSVTLLGCFIMDMVK